MTYGLHAMEGFFILIIMGIVFIKRCTVLKVLIFGDLGQDFRIFRIFPKWKTATLVGQDSAWEVQKRYFRLKNLVFWAIFGHFPLFGGFPWVPYWPLCNSRYTAHWPLLVSTLSFKPVRSGKSQILKLTFPLSALREKFFFYTCFLYW